GISRPASLTIKPAPMASRAVPDATSLASKAATSTSSACPSLVSIKLSRHSAGPKTNPLHLSFRGRSLPEESALLVCREKQSLRYTRKRVVPPYNLAHGQLDRKSTRLNSSHVA